MIASGSQGTLAFIPSVLQGGVSRVDWSQAERKSEGSHLKHVQLPSF